MKIIHEIYSRAQTGAGVRPYALGFNESGPPDSGYADVTIVCPGNEQVPEDAIHIEGDLRMVRTALREALWALEQAAESLAARDELSDAWNELP